MDSRVASCRRAVRDIYVLALVVAAGHACLGESPAPRVVYHYVGDPEVDPNRFLRAYQASRGFDLSPDRGYLGRHSLKFRAQFTETHRRLTVIWALPPVLFDTLRLRVWNTVSPEQGEVFLGCNLQDVDKRPFFLSWYGAAGSASAQRPPRAALPFSRPDAGNSGWTLYHLKLPDDIVHVGGDKKATATPLPDKALKTLFIIFEVAPDSPLIGKEAVFYLDGLELTWTPRE